MNKLTDSCQLPLLMFLALLLAFNVLKLWSYGSDIVGYELCEKHTVRAPLPPIQPRDGTLVMCTNTLILFCPGLRRIRKKRSACNTRRRQFPQERERLTWN
ncbi:MAG: hypothetical protein Kow0099_06920 [Candidatus Abyssubacteria bacterium]